MADEPAAVRPLYQAVAEALADHDKATAVRTAVEAVSSGAVSIPELYRDVLTRILADTGEAWHAGRAPSGRSTSRAPPCAPSWRSCIRACSRPRRRSRRPGAAVLLACPPEEAHDLGLRMVADRFDMAGWTTYFLGPDTPVEEIADAATRLGVDAVVMSSSTHYHRLAVRHAVDALKRTLPDIDVWVGGPAFVGAATAGARGDRRPGRVCSGREPAPRARSGPDARRAGEEG